MVYFTKNSQIIQTKHLYIFKILLTSLNGRKKFFSLTYIGTQVENKIKLRIDSVMKNNT